MMLQVGVKVFLQREKHEYLFLRRSKTSDDVAELWDIPGGRIGPAEPLSDALKREVSEETGLLLDADARLIAAQDIFVEKKDLHVIRLTYVGTASGTVRLSPEHDESKWLNKEAIAKLPNLDPYIREILYLL